MSKVDQFIFWAFISKYSPNYLDANMDFKILLLRQIHIASQLCCINVM